MLDVNQYMDRTLEIKLSNRTLHVYEPTHNMYLEALQHEETDKTTDFIAYQGKLVLDMLNRNKENIKLNEKEFKELPRGFVTDIYKTLMVLCVKAVSDPN